MNYIRHHFFVALLPLVLICSCSSKKGEVIITDYNTLNKELLSVQKDMDSSLRSWNLEGNSKIKNLGDSIMVKIDLIDSNVFHGENTNGTIASLLLFDNDSFFSQTKLALFEFNLLAFNYSVTFRFENPKNFKENRQKFNSKKYTKAVRYSLENLMYEEVAAFESVTKYLVENLEGNYYYSDYWTLLAELDEFANYRNEAFSKQADLFRKTVLFLKELTMPGCTDDSYAKFVRIFEMYGIYDGENW